MEASVCETKCTYCAHRKVCKSTEKYISILKEINEKIYLSRDNEFSVTLECNNFLENYTAARNASTKVTNKQILCETCGANPINTHGVTVGESPCQWCNENPMKEDY